MIRRITSLLGGAALTLSLVAAPANAEEAEAEFGSTALAAVLTSDQVAFDRDFRDYDILTAHSSAW